MKFSDTLLDKSPSLLSSPGDLNACLNARGLYNSFQFVLRLSPEVHRQLNGLPLGIVTGKIDFAVLQAFSTYLHETIHWWQHVGSTAGFVRSLSYPAQTHANYSHLKNALTTIGAKKPIQTLINTIPGPGGPGTLKGLANTVVNNHYDIEFYRVISTNPSLAFQAIKHPLFDCLGHSHATTYANILAILAGTFDKNFDTLPDPRGWEKEFAALRSRKEKGYYFGSDVMLAPIGAHEILEGQARFAQLQYLYFASGGKLSWNDIRSKGMLSGVYGRAFETFLSGAELDWPPSIDHPTVALFLLVCDVAINAGAGFPMPLRFFASFIADVDPGLRFLFLSRTIATKRPDVARTIVDYSRKEYIEVAEALTNPLLIDSPLAVAETVARWARENEGLKSLMAEHETFDYCAENLPVRVLFSHFVAFNVDRQARPEFFCWPGAWMAGARLSSEIVALFDRHSALFVDKADEDGVFPRTIPGRSEATIQRAFQSFYAFNVTYDMTRQWITKPGPFEYDYRWLSPSGTQADFKGFADRHFEMTYGVHPDSFEIM